MLCLPMVLILLLSCNYLVMCCDCDLWHDISVIFVTPFVTLWLSYDTFSYSTLVMIQLNKTKQNKRKNRKWLSYFAKSWQKVSSFFVVDGQLWKKDPRMRYKLVVQERKWLGIVKQAHDKLGHKDIFTIYTHILEHFWWPYFDDNVC